MLESIMYKQEIAAFIMAALVLEIASYLFGKQQKVTRSVWGNQIIILILAVYYTGVCHFTLLHRDVMAGMKYELSLFWSYRYTIEHDSLSFFKEVVYNIILLFPMGILMPMYLKLFQKWKVTVAAGFILSTMIEVCQLISQIGWFEFDDMFNNTLGASMGYSVYYLIACLTRKERERRWLWKLGILLTVDVCVVLYFWRLWKQIG